MSTNDDPTAFNTIAGVLGNVLEWYDFALFGFFSDIIAVKFFPPSSSQDNTNLLYSFALFGGAFLMRPIGGLAIGYIGDKHGRKTALTFALFLMGIPTFAMGCLPTYEAVGSLSIVLLAICRLLQGMSVGGQLPASLIYTVEKRPRNLWALYGSLVMMAANVGTLLGNLVGATLRSALSEEQLLLWGWRIPFVSGILIIFVAIYLKCWGVEHHPNAGVYDHQDSEIKNPLAASFRKGNRWPLVSCALTPMLWAAGFYVTFVWMAIYMEDLVEPPIPNAFWINFGTLLLGLTAFLPLSAMLSDKVGRVRTMVVGAVLTGICGPLLLIVISKGAKAWEAFLCQWALGVLISLFGGPLCAWLVESFPAEVRLTSASLGYDIAHALGAGFSPLLATVLVDRKGSAAAGAIYPIFAFLSLLGLGVIKCCGGGNEIESKSQESDDGDIEVSEKETTKEDGSGEVQINPIT